MVDFAKLREDNRRRIEAEKNKPTVITPKKPNYLMRINHLIEYHLGEMTGWEEQFCYSNKEFMVNTKAVKEDKPEDLEHILTEKVKSKIAELENSFCTSVCHGLMKANIPHG